jgi:hypothetical protein
MNQANQALNCKGGLSSWERVLSAARPENRADILKNALSELFPLAKAAAVSSEEIEDWAVRQGEMYDIAEPYELQQIIVKAATPSETPADRLRPLNLREFLASWERTIASAPPENRPGILERAVRELMWLAAKAGLSPVEVADWATGIRELHQIADLDGVQGMNEAAVENQANGSAAGGTVGTNSGVLGQPQPLPKGLLPVDDFDLEFLPAALQAWVADISDRLQCPPDYVAVTAVVALGSLIGRRIGLKPQVKTDWLETPNIWGGFIGRPGMLKSPAMQEALKPLHRLEAEAAKDHDVAMEAYAAGISEFKVRQEVRTALEKQALKKAKSGKIKNICFELGDEPKKPTAIRFRTNDSSYEALGELLKDNPNGLLMERDELISLLMHLDREDQIVARGFYLSGWSGTQTYSFDRIGRGHIHLDAICISVLGGTQPARISQYVRRANLGGAGGDGLIQRFGVLVWPDVSPSWRNVDEFPNSEARERVWKVFDRVAKLDLQAVLKLGASKGPFDKLPCLRFDAAAHDEFLGWRSDLETRLRTGALAPALEGHLAKYRKLVPALALINAIADADEGAVTHKSLLRALAFAAYLESHAKRIYGSVTEGEASGWSRDPETYPGRRAARRLYGSRYSSPWLGAPQRPRADRGGSDLALRSRLHRRASPLCKAAGRATKSDLRDQPDGLVMNHYLIKLREIERAANDSFVSFVSPPNRLESEKRDEKEAATRAAKGFVSFVSDESKPFENSKCATEPNRQNRQNSDRVISGNPAARGEVTGHPYDRVLAVLHSKCPELIEAARWQQAVRDAEVFIPKWGEQAQTLGWTVEELFGLHPVPQRPAPSFRRLSRYDSTGLIWLLQGRPVIALAETEAAIQSAGAVVIYRKHRKPAFGPLGDCLDDMDLRS